VVSDFSSPRSKHRSAEARRVLAPHLVARELVRADERHPGPPAVGCLRVQRLADRRGASRPSEPGPAWTATIPPVHCRRDGVVAGTERNWDMALFRLIPNPATCMGSTPADRYHRRQDLVALREAICDGTRGGAAKDHQPPRPRSRRTERFGSAPVFRAGRSTEQARPVP
jgi:hypothetical protein